MQVSSGEDVVDAGVKTGAHVAIGTVGAEFGATVGSVFPVVGTIGGAAVGFTVGVAGSMLFDSAYDNVIKPFVENPQ